MKKHSLTLVLVLWSSIILTATLFSCNNPNTPNVSEITWGDLDYWQDYNIGDTFAYVNEENDSMIFEVTEKFQLYEGYPKPGDDDYDPNDFVESPESKRIGNVCISEHNFLNHKLILRQFSYLVGINYYDYNTQFYDESKRTYLFFNGGPNYSGYIKSDYSNITEVLSDTLYLRLPFKNEQGTYDGGGIAVRGKGTIWFIDRDGHRWELVDLMNK
ncbi:MAG: hypothetical protein MJZ98_06070 [Paludibacteraceae bacterium]|nr:hypothetical protein [Paludibacteraceae bacterium]